MEGRSTVGLFLLVLVAAASRLVMLQERRLTATTIITTTTTTTTTNVLKHNDEPFTIFTLYSSSGREMASLAMMLDDVSISGFANRTGHWHAFQGHEHHLPGSTPLPFGNSYRDLIGGLPNLPNLPLGEAQRLQPIWDLLAEGWESGEARVNVEHLPYIEHWDTICYEILSAEKNGVWDGPFTELLREHANIKSKKKALAVVGVITNSNLEELMEAHARSA
nr:unnamed protein product [Digitaria exilis]